MRSLIVTLLLLFICLEGCYSTVVCPRLPSGEVLTCAYECCESFGGKDQGYHCCGNDGKNFVTRPEDAQNTRAERYAGSYSNNTFQIDYSLLLLGIIISIVVSILLSLLLCFLCNSCFLGRRHHPDNYESVNDGFYPLCCGLGIPTGTIVFSSQPPQFHNNDIYSGSNSSYSSRNNRVRFNENGEPIRGVLKNGSYA
ncbi:hypothetical protein M3Y94_00139100 [Aphelenchoides besseyi]|nr:hypothetical protein M3Y94_00139100 [Aphelenchoides besseyi]